MLQLQSLHSKAAQIILDLPIGSSASDTLNKLKWKTLARRRAEHRATFNYKCLNNLFSHRLILNSIRINMIIILDVKLISVIVHLVGTGGIGPRRILPQTIGINETFQSDKAHHQLVLKEC